MPLQRLLRAGACTACHAPAFQHPFYVCVNSSQRGELTFKRQRKPQYTSVAAAYLQMLMLMLTLIWGLSSLETVHHAYSCPCACPPRCSSAIRRFLQCQHPRERHALLARCPKPFPAHWGGVLHLTPCDS